jgi:hypothetical protein
MVDTTQYGMNPYTSAQANGIQQQSNQNLAQNVMPGIGQGATGAGQYGGSRQGIAQGVAAGNAQAGVANAQANLYSNAYGQDQAFANANRGMDLQQQSLNNNYDTTNRGLDLQGQSLNNNFYTTNRGLDLQGQSQTNNFYTQNRQLDQSGMQLGANLYNAGNTGNLGAGQGQYNLGLTAQNAPISALQQYSNTISPYSGLNSAQTSTSTTGGGAQGVMGGALAGAQIYNNLGFGGSASPTNMTGFQQPYAAPSYQPSAPSNGLGTGAWSGY